MTEQEFTGNSSRPAGIQPTARHGYAVGLMVSSSVVISFTGLIVRHLDADPMVMNFYRAVSLTVAVILILVVRYRRMAITHVIGIGWSGLLGGAMLTVAAISFLQSMTHTTVANTLFVLGAIPFSFYYFPYLVTTLKNYDPVTYYENLLDMLLHYSNRKFWWRRLGTTTSQSLRLLYTVRTLRADLDGK